MTAKSVSSVFSNIVRVLAFVVAAAVCLGVLGIGLHWVYQQHTRITTFQPISVEIENSWVRESKGRKYRTYEPVIEYKFEKDGTWYRAEGLHPSYSKGRQAWAQAMVAKYPAGSTTQAYINPEDPTQAFLIPHYSSTPYCVFLIAGLFTVLAVGMGFDIKTTQTRYQTQGEALSVNTQGRSPGSSRGVLEQWVVLTPRKRLASRANMWGWLAFLSLVFLLTFSHYFWYAARPYENYGLVMSGIALGITLGLAIAWIVVKRAANTYSDAMLAIDRVQLAQGDLIGATLAITPSTNISQAILSCNLICIETQTKVTKSKKETVAVQVIKQFVFEDEIDEAMAMVPILRDFSISIPTYDPLKDAEPLENPGITSKVLPKDEPVLAWSLIINIKAWKKPDYTGEFPLLIDPSDASPSNPRR